MSDEFNVVLVGCGNMGTAIIERAIEKEVLAASAVIAIDRDLQKARDFAIRVGCGGGDVVHGSSEPTCFVIATKPQDVKGAIANLPRKASDIFVSVAAGVNTDSLRTWTGTDSIVRTMPNTPALVGCGATAIFSPTGEIPALVTQIFEACGLVFELQKEAHFDGVTGLSGSGPAFVFVAIEALSDGGVAAGLPREMALELAVQTVFGASVMVEKTGSHPGVLKDKVASPGGTTIAGLAALENGGFRSALIDAVVAAAKRNRELS